MSQEPSNKENIQKLMIDRPTDFKFHAAYLTYSEAWDKTSSQESKRTLNESIILLSKGEIDYETFYQKISHYRTEPTPKQYTSSSGLRIETQRKRDWREKEARTARNARHRK